MWNIVKEFQCDTYPKTSLVLCDSLICKLSSKETRALMFSKQLDLLKVHPEPSGFIFNFLIQSDPVLKFIQLTHMVKVNRMSVDISQGC